MDEQHRRELGELREKQLTADAHLREAELKAEVAVRDQRTLELEVAKVQQKMEIAQQSAQGTFSIYWLMGSQIGSTAKRA